VAPSHSSPIPMVREELPTALGRESFQPEHTALQGTIVWYILIGRRLVQPGSGFSEEEVEPHQN
jgi:hypothetical protein